MQGVGSHAAHLLLRSGVGKLRLVDFDQVTLSSLNRHAVATRQDVGIPKATCLQRHFQQIMPEVGLVTGLQKLPPWDSVLIAISHTQLCLAGEAVPPAPGNESPQSRGMR